MGFYKSLESESLLKDRGPHKDLIAAQSYGDAPQFTVEVGKTIEFGSKSIFGDIHNLEEIFHAEDHNSCNDEIAQ